MKFCSEYLADLFFLIQKKGEKKKKKKTMINIYNRSAGLVSLPILLLQVFFSFLVIDHQWSIYIYIYIYICIYQLVFYVAGTRHYTPPPPRHTDNESHDESKPPTKEKLVQPLSPLIDSEDEFYENKIIKTNAVTLLLLTELTESQPGGKRE